jgi:hypothetical protein
MIMIAFRNFNLLASFPRKLLRLFRQGITTKQRFSAPFWMYRTQLHWQIPGTKLQRNTKFGVMLFALFGFAQNNSAKNLKSFSENAQTMIRYFAPCVSGARNLKLGATLVLRTYSSITTGVPSSTRSNSSITSALRIRTQP